MHLRCCCELHSQLGAYGFSPAKKAISKRENLIAKHGNAKQGQRKRGTGQRSDFPFKNRAKESLDERLVRLEGMPWKKCHQASDPLCLH